MLCGYFANQNLAIPYPFFLSLKPFVEKYYLRRITPLYLGFRNQLTMFLIKLYMLLSSGGQLILFVLFGSLLTPSNVSLLSNMSVEVLDTFR
jgi:hypothetical protein